jgi:hypothetical protein
LRSQTEEGKRKEPKERGSRGKGTDPIGESHLPVIESDRISFEEKFPQIG